MKKTAAWFHTLLILSVIFVAFYQIAQVRAQSTVYIRADGTVEGTGKIQKGGDVYKLIDTLSASLVIQKSNIVVDGAGHKLQGTGTETGIDLTNGRGQDPSRPRIENVTVKNMEITNFFTGINLANSNNISIIGNYISDFEREGIYMFGGDFLIKHNTIENIHGAEQGSIAIYFAHSGERIITENNFINPAIMFYLSSNTTFDRNYWKGYNVPDEDGDGIRDIPYTVFERDYAKLVDEHPLKSPVEISVIPEFSTEIILPIFICSILFAVICKKHLEKNDF
jgi:nitrous oxidase accessory protein NosD